MPKSASKSLSVQMGGDHYKDMVIQPIEFCYYNEIPAIESSIIKYVVRHKKKGQKLDLNKAIHLLNILIELEYSEDIPEQNELKL